MTANNSELLDLERRFWDAMKTKDANVASQMTDDQCIVVGAQGVSSVDSKSMGKMTAEGKWRLDRYSFDEKNAQIRYLTDDIAIVAYKVSEQVTLDGKSMPIEANDASVWVKRGGEWRCALHTESLAGDPYGRDKNKNG